MRTYGGIVKELYERGRAAREVVGLKSRVHV